MDTPKPRTIFSDRGPGFYHKCTGYITGEYDTVCRLNNFVPGAGLNSKEGPRAQSPDIPDVLLHETAIAWLKRLVDDSTPAKPWLESPDQLKQRILNEVRYVNRNYEVKRLCKEFPQRLQDLVHVTKGDRLNK